MADKNNIYPIKADLPDVNRWDDFNATEIYLATLAGIGLLGAEAGEMFSNPIVKYTLGAVCVASCVRLAFRGFTRRSSETPEI